MAVCYLAVLGHIKWRFYPCLFDRSRAYNGRAQAIVLRKTEEDRTKFCSVRWSVLASLSEYMFGFEVDKFSNKKKRPAVLIIHEEVHCTRSISSLLHIYRCTANVSLLVKTKELFFFFWIQIQPIRTDKHYALKPKRKTKNDKNF